jgi:hypothetical protein
MGNDIYPDLSLTQRKRFKEISGREYPGFQLSGSFATDRPFDEEWTGTPWNFSYVFHTGTGNLICEMSHHMTNNRTYGFTYDGNRIEGSVIESIFPSDLGITIEKIVKNDENLGTEVS